MSYKLTFQQEEQFNKIVEDKKETIRIALSKCNIKSKDFDEFYSYALEGLLLSFILVEKGVIPREDFDRFSFVTMKRKVIDELRRRNKEKLIPIEEVENLKLFESRGCKIREIEFLEDISKVLTFEEQRVFAMLVLGYEAKEIFATLNIKKSRGYNVLANVRKKCRDALYKSC